MSEQVVTPEAPVAPPAEAPAPAAPAPAAPAAPASALASGAAGAPPATPAAPPEPVIPEKFIVKGADGQIDHAATAKKVAEGYTGLEKRLGSGDAPPQTVDGYKVNVPEALKDKINPEELAKAPDFKDFMGKLHAAGASQKVVDAAVATMLERGIAMREAAPVLDAAECTATLRQQDGWKSDQEYAQQIGLAFNATRQIFGPKADTIVQKYGNDPDFVAGMASIGREMEEDRGPSPEAQAQLTANLDTLMSSPAYLNPNDPKHADTVAKVNALHAQMYGSKAISGGRTITIKT